MDLDITRSLTRFSYKNFLAAVWVMVAQIGLLPLSAKAVETETANNAHQLNLKNDPRVGLVLGGGGARGAAHVGVLKILEQNGIKIDCIVGTNVGAVVGGLYSAGVSLTAIEEMFTKKSLMRSYLDVPAKLKVMVVPLFFVPRLLGKRGYDGLYKGSHFRDFLNKYVPESEQDICDCKISFAAVALNLIDGKTTLLKNGNLGTALQASSAIPVLRKPVKFQNGLYVDGGVVNNLPVEQAREMGADIIIAVDLDDPENLNMQMSSFSKLGTVSHRVISLHLTNVDRERIKQANLTIHPEVDQINMMSTRGKDAQTALEAGERAAIESLDKIKKILQDAGIETLP